MSIAVQRLVHIRKLILIGGKCINRSEKKSSDGNLKTKIDPQKVSV